jgi:hypothetical protein
MASGLAAVYSPPRKMPSMSLRRMSSTSAATPIAWKPGSNAIKRVTTPKPLTAIMVVFRRPILSPRWPKMNEPIGRPINVTAKTT